MSENFSEKTTTAVFIIIFRRFHLEASSSLQFELRTNGCSVIADHFSFHSLSCWPLQVRASQFLLSFVPRTFARDPFQGNEENRSIPCLCLCLWVRAPRSKFGNSVARRAAIEAATQILAHRCTWVGARRSSRPKAKQTFSRRDSQTTRRERRFCCVRPTASESERIRPTAERQQPASPQMKQICVWPTVTGLSLGFY